MVSHPRKGALLCLLIMVVVWIDNHDVYAIFTLNSDSLTIVKRQVDGTVKEVTCPEIIADFNTFMGNVDLVDQAMCYYSIGRKTVRWWRQVFWRMHDHAVTNAYIIYKYCRRFCYKRVEHNVSFLTRGHSRIFSKHMTLHKRNSTYGLIIIKSDST